MCRGCKMDPSEVAKMQLRQGAVPVEDFDDEVPYRHAPRKKKRAKTRPGCPGNDYKAHVYVWTTENEYRDFFYDYFGFPRNQTNTCVGCGKTNGSKPSDEYMKRKEREWAKLATPEKGVPVSRWRYRSNRHLVSFRWWSWEYQDEDYRKARKEYIDLHGWPKYMYGF